MADKQQTNRGDAEGWAERIWRWYLAQGGSPTPTPALRAVYEAYRRNQKEAQAMPDSVQQTKPERCPPIDLLALAQERRAKAKNLVLLREMSNTDPAGLRLYEDAQWRRTLASLDVMGVENLIADLQEVGHGR